MSIIELNTIRKMSSDEFLCHMVNIKKLSSDVVECHVLMDALMVKALESCGYDLRIFKSAAT